MCYGIVLWQDQTTVAVRACVSRCLCICVSIRTNLQMRHGMYGYTNARMSMYGDTDISDRCFYVHVLFKLPPF